jgi:hypothetical protein
MVITTHELQTSDGRHLHCSDHALPMRWRPRMGRRSALKRAFAGSPLPANPAAANQSCPFPVNHRQGTGP